jgi:hypothetical protein
MNLSKRRATAATGDRLDDPVRNIEGGKLEGKKTLVTVLIVDDEPAVLT